MANNISAEQKAKQSALIQTWKPWNKSTGPRTAQGKAIVSRNAYKGAVRPKARAECKLLNSQMQRELAERKSIAKRNAEKEYQRALSKAG